MKVCAKRLKIESHLCRDPKVLFEQTANKKKSYMSINVSAMCQVSWLVHQKFTPQKKKDVSGQNSTTCRFKNKQWRE